MVAAGVGRDVDRVDGVGEGSVLGAERVMEVAAAGGHNVGLVVVGGAVVGSLPAARRITGPWLDRGARGRAPFVSVGSASSHVELIGGYRRPGLLDAAHGGVLCVDAGARLGNCIQECLRRVLQAGEVRVERVATGEVDVRPARFQMVAAVGCVCSGGSVSGLCDCWCRQARRNLGLLADWVDLVVAVSGDASAGAASTRGWAARVWQARAAAAERWSEVGRVANAEAALVDPEGVVARMDPAGRAVLRDAQDRGLLSKRGVPAAAAVAWTLSDLDGRSGPDAGDVNAAVALRLAQRPPLPVI